MIMKLPQEVILDTNIPIISNKNVADVSNDELHRWEVCIDIINHVTDNGILVIDSSGEIILEYKKNLNFSGAPGLGDRFFKWVFDNQFSSSLIKRVDVAKNDEDYVNFPKDENLSKFDKSDMKFVALSNTSSPPTAIVEASDGKWWKWSKILKKYSIDVLFVDEAIAEKGCRKKNRCGDKNCDECI